MIQEEPLALLIDLLNLSVIPPIIALVYQIYKSRKETKQQNQLKIVEILITEFRDRFDPSQGDIYNQILREFLNIYFKVLEKPFLSKREQSFRKAISLIFTELLNFDKEIKDFSIAINPFLKILV